MSVAAAEEPSPLEVRPRFRGTLHRIAAPTGAVAFVLLALAAETAGATIAIAVYGVCVTTMLAVSGTYHSPRISDTTRRRLKRVDHSTILLAIAGSYTAVTVLALEGGAEVAMLVLCWAFAIAGVVIRMLWLDAPRPLVSAVYVVTGWLLVFDLPGYLDGLNGVEFALLAAGGLLYTVGAIVYARKRPDPWPATFGYHEVFHTLVVVAALCHYLAVLSLVRS
jgi:hemolysin III